MDRVFGQAFATVFASHFAAGDRANHAVDVGDGQLGADFFAAFDGGLAEREQVGVVEGLLESVVLLLRADAEDLVADIRLVEDRGEIHAGGLPVIGSFAGV